MTAPAFTDFSTLCGELDALIEGPPAHDEAARARLERTLTDGYARAHSLEAEQLRIERRIGELASEMSDRDREHKADELAELSLQLSRASADLRHLRKLLADARRRISAAA
jgi:chromosome segregation ATPase